MHKMRILLSLLLQTVSLFSAESLTFIETGLTDQLDEEELFYRSQIRQKARKIQFERHFEDEGQLEEFKARLAKTLKNFDTFKTDKTAGRYLFHVKNKDHLVALVVVALFPEEPALIVPLAMLSEVNKTELWRMAEREAKKRGALEVVPFYSNSGASRRISTSSEELALREVDEKELRVEEQVTTTKIALVRHMSARPIPVQSAMRARTGSESSTLLGGKKEVLPKRLSIPPPARSHQVFPVRRGSSVSESS